MKHELIGRLPPGRGVPEYIGDETDTARVYVDNKQRQIKVDVSPSITSSIEVNSTRIQRLAAALETKAEIASVEAATEKLQTKLDKATIAIAEEAKKDVLDLQEMILEKLSQLSILVDRTCPINVEKFATNYDSIVKVGTILDMLDVTGEFNKPPKTLKLYIEDKIVDSLENTSEYSYRNSFSLETTLQTTSCIVDFGSEPQNVSDEFYNLFSAIASQVIESDSTTEGDEEEGYVITITAPSTTICGTDEIIIISEDENNGS